MPWAALLAGRGGTIVLLRVNPAKPTYAETLLALAGGGDDSVQRIEEAWNQVATTDLDEAAQAVADAGVTIERVIAEGEPDEWIVDTAANRGVDMIAMTSHGRGAIGRAIFGSVADRVARTATVPVLIVRAAGEDAPQAAAVKRIVVPLDGSELAERALPIASEIAKRLRVPIHVFRAVDPVTAMPVAPGVFGAAPTVSGEIADQIWEEAESEANQTVRDAVADLQKQHGIDAAGSILHGSPFFAISEATRPDDLLVLTSHGRGGVRRWLLGSVAEKLIREAPAPVLLVPALERGEVGESVSR
jgi:nucleotide-binding universal stress UspA family protein